MSDVVVVTGGLGFIGSALVLELVKSGYTVVNIDKETYSANRGSLSEIEKSGNYRFFKLDIQDFDNVSNVLRENKPVAIINLAAETHVDRSIDAPRDFIDTNISGTYHLLQAARYYLLESELVSSRPFKFIHVSTDEVFGDLEADDPPFSEHSAYRPSSPYSATKAASDHLVRAWGRTYELPVIVTNCSNNYGPRQYPEKLIPLMLERALKGGSLPIYGSGANIRDWLYVDDHARALKSVMRYGEPGETYLIGGNSEISNLDLVRRLCAELDKQVIEKPAGVDSFEQLITFVSDRPGHDRRYAINSQKIQRELKWRPEETLETGLKKTVAWYLSNPMWRQSALQKNALQRQGLGEATK